MSRWYRVWVASGFLAFLAAYLYRTFSGYYFYDDYSYARFAHQLTEGTFSLQFDTFSHRVGFLLPIAALYTVLGINDFSTILWPLLGTVGTIALLFYYLRSDPTVCFYATSATALNSYFIFFSDKVSPDTPLTFFLLIAGVLAERFRTTYPLRAGVGVIVALFSAFMTKETAMYTFPFFAGLIFHEYWKGDKPGKIFALAAILTGFCLSVAYFSTYYIYTGNPLYRFTSIVENHYVYEGNYIDKPISVIIQRLTYAPWVMFLEAGLLVAILPGTITVIYLLRRPRVYGLSLYRFWAWYVVPMLACYWFLSTSTRYYTPLPLSPRMYFPLLPPFAILAGYWWKRSEESARARAWLAFLFGAATICGFFFHSKYAPVYAGLTLLPLLSGIRRKKWALTLTVRTLFIALLLTVPAYRMVRPQQWGYQAEKLFFAKYFSQPEGKYLVVTDERLAGTYDWYSQFKPNPHYRFVDFSSSSSSASYERAFVLFNPHTFRNSPLPLAPWESWQQQHSGELKLLEERDGVRLYEWRP